jgi:hypothetical protein
MKGGWVRQEEELETGAKCLESGLIGTAAQPPRGLRPHNGEYRFTMGRSGNQLRPGRREIFRSLELGGGRFEASAPILGNIGSPWGGVITNCVQAGAKYSAACMLGGGRLRPPPP